MKKIYIIIFITIFASVNLSAQYISEVLEYKPAPGQLINTTTWGFPSSSASVVGGINGSLCLGAFGGYVVFRFANPVANHPDNPFGVDFTIFGNPQQNWAEPGIVSVMKDENANGLPDDTWFELAGSDYWFSSTIKNYEVTYTNPGLNVAADVPWSDNQGNTGYVYANPVHTQPYYPVHDSFPTINPENYMLSGTKIKHVMDTSNPGFVQSPQRAFGYADNNLRGTEPYTIPDNPYTSLTENSGGDAFDISWAVNVDGNYVDLDEIDFVKIHNAVQANAGWLGEISTEIAGAVDVEANNSINGNLYQIVIKDLPPVIKNQIFQLEAFVFYMGRLLPDEQIIWQTNMPEANIDDNYRLTVTTSGDLEITALMENNPGIFTSASAVVDLSSASISGSTSEAKISLYPNPAKTFIKILGIDAASIKIWDVNGNCLFSDVEFNSQKMVDISGFNPGLFLVRIFNNEKYRILKFIKK